MRNRWAAMALGVFIGVAAPAAQQQSANPAALPPLAAQPIPLYKVGLGTFTRKISSSNAEAQAFFDQGFQMMYSFAKPEAVRSFREAWKRDPECAICYWGEAWAWGSNLNAAMSAEESPLRLCRRAEGALAESEGRAAERALIDALAVRYVERFDATTPWRAGRGLRRGHGEGLREVSRRSRRRARCTPTRCFCSNRGRAAAGPTPATQNLDPRTSSASTTCWSGCSRATRTIPARATLRARDRVDGEAAAAQAVRRVSRPSIPGASHINHMPSHTLNEVGRWGDSVRANLEAWHSDLKAAIGEGFAIYPVAQPAHAALCRGRWTARVRSRCGRARTTRSSPATRCYQVLTLIRFGRFDEVLEVTNRPEREIPAGALGLRAGLREAARRRDRRRSAGTSSV